MGPTLVVDFQSDVVRELQKGIRHGVSGHEGGGALGGRHIEGVQVQLLVLLQIAGVQALDAQAEAHVFHLLGHNAKKEKYTLIFCACGVALYQEDK
jgi:hypothetical protein